MTTTEVAVITFLLVGAAIVVLGIIYTAAKGNADNIPDARAARTVLTVPPSAMQRGGMTTIQVAILFPAVLLWLMLIVQYGLWWHAKQVANAAAAEARRRRPGPRRHRRRRRRGRSPVPRPVRQPHERHHRR